MKISRNAKSPKRGQTRRRVVPLWRSRKVRGTLIALLVVLAAGGGWRMWQSGWVPGAIDKAKWKMIALASDLGFKVDEIFVIGRRETAQKDLLAALRLVRGAPILAFDLQAARKRIEALPWIKTASVERMLPDTVLLNIEERQPLALWQHKGAFALIDSASGTISSMSCGRAIAALLTPILSAPWASSSLRTSTLPDRAAAINTVSPSGRVVLASAPASSSASTIGAFPRPAARASGVTP